jgi:hypothetical protein
VIGFLEQRTNVKFWVKLRKLSLHMKHGAFNTIPRANNKVCTANSQHTHDPSKLSHVGITNEESVHHFLRYQENYSLCIHSTRLNSQPSLLCGNTEAVM